jgi:hypothetical protein
MVVLSGEIEKDFLINNGEWIGYDTQLFGYRRASPVYDAS